MKYAKIQPDGNRPMLEDTTAEPQKFDFSIQHFEDVGDHIQVFPVGTKIIIDIVEMSEKEFDELPTFLGYW
jgi:hypothetical protein